MTTSNLEVLSIVGPTASGKTALSIELAKLLNGEIINGDAMQVYRELNIGTAKITREEMEGIPHHMIDIRNPEDSFSVADYQALVRECIEDIRSRGKLPIIVGGTGLYIQSVLFDFRFTEEATDELIRKKFEDELKVIGREALYEKLVKVDPESAKTIHPNNTRRVIRALEIVELTGKSKMDVEEQRGNRPLFNFLIVGLTMDRELLYSRINERVEVMLSKGLEEEVRNLFDSGLKDVQSIKAIGYKEFYDYFTGHVSKEDAVENIKKNSRNYAKRQLTYFKNKLNIHWFDSTEGLEKNLPEILKLVKGFRGII